MTELFVYVTAAGAEEAKAIARAVVTERLAACANILDGATSVFRWEGKLCEEREAVMVLKTTEDRLGALEARIRALHAYATPCVVALPITGGSRAYLDWVVSETRPEK